LISAGRREKNGSVWRGAATARQRSVCGREGEPFFLANYGNAHYTILFGSGVGTMVPR